MIAAHQSPAADDGREPHGPLGEPGERRARDTERAAQADLHTVLRMCEAGEIRCSEKTGRASAVSVRSLGSRLVGGDFYLDDPIAAFAWPLIVQAGGLARVESGRLRLTPKGGAALRSPSAEVMARLWARWLSHGVLDELNRVEAIKGQRSANVLSAVRNRRQTVAAALAHCPPGKWIAVDDLFEMMRRRHLHPTVTRSSRALWRLYLVDPQYGSLGYDGYHPFELLEGRYTLALVFEYAATLGLVDVDYVHPDGARDDFRGNWGADDLPALSRYDGLRAIRLNALGAYVLGLADNYRPPEPEQASLVVTADLHVLATSLEPDDERVLSTFGEREADGVWRLSRSSLLTAVDVGAHPRELLDFLAPRTVHEPPAALGALVEEVATRVGELTNHGVVRLVEVADDAVARRLLGDRILRGLLRAVGERHLAVPVDQEPAVRSRLISLGYALPAQPR